MRFTLKSIIILLLIMFLIVQSGQQIYANNKVDFNVTISDGFFEIGKLKPGHSEISTLTINNAGNLGFNYNAKLRYISGSKQLFDMIHLQVKNANENIYEGKLNKFEGISEKYLKQKNNESFYFTFHLPEAVGNEFQGLSTEIGIKVNAKGILSSAVEEEKTNANLERSFELPSTSTSIFNLIFCGLVIMILGTILYWLKIIKTKNT